MALANFGWMYLAAAKCERPQNLHQLELPGCISYDLCVTHVGCTEFTHPHGPQGKELI